MFRRFFLAAMLTTSMGLCAQYQPGSMYQAQAASATQPGSQPVIVVPSAPSVYVVGGGLYGTGVYLVNPGTLPTQNVGVSLAGRTGISLQTPLQTGAFTGAPSLSGEPIYNATAYSGATPESAGGAVAAESGRLIYDMGPSYYAGSGAGEAVEPAPSLGEVAAQYKARLPHNVRTFTNADVQRLTNKVTIPGAAVGPPQPPVPPPPKEH